MGCISSKPATTYFESMLNKIIQYTKAKYETINDQLAKDQMENDLHALDEIGLFITGSKGGNRIYRIDKCPMYGREVPIQSPVSIGHFTKLVNQFFGWPMNAAVIDLSFRQVVSQEMITAVLYAVNTVDISRTLNFARQRLNEEHVQMISAWIGNSVNLQYLSLVSCKLNQKSCGIIAQGLNRLPRRRAKLETVERCDEISVNDQEAFIYEVPARIPVNKGLLCIDVSRNNIGDLGCTSILDALTGHQELQFLGFAHTDFGEIAMGSLVQLLQDVNTIQHIDLSGNAALDDKTAAPLLGAAKLGRSLQTVLLSDTNVSNKFEVRLQQYLTRNKAVTQAYDDLLNGAFVRLFNSSEMAGQCQGKGSDSYIEYAVSEYYPTNLTDDEERVITRIQQKISIHEGYIKLLAKMLAGKYFHDSVSASEANISNATIQDFTISLSETIGRRPEMEDIVSVIPDFQEYRLKRNGVTYNQNDHFEILICLFDGHGGSETAKQAGALFPAVFADTVNAILGAVDLQYCYQLPDKLWEPLMFSVFQRVDETLKFRGCPAGSTAIVCFVTEHLIVSANAGDSRAILIREEGSSRRFLSRRGSITGDQETTSTIYNNDSIFKQTSSVSLTRLNEMFNEQSMEEYYATVQVEENVNSDINPADVVLRLSKDHKPDLPEEKRRVESVGGYIHQGRIMSTLAVARGFGDFTYKPSVTVSPYVNTYRLQKQDAWLIVCCDGVWDVLSDLDAALIVHRSMTAGVAAITLRDEAFRLDSGDNISAVAMRLFFK